MTRKKVTSKTDQKSILKRAKLDRQLAEKVAKWEKKQDQILARKQIKEMRPYLKKLKDIDLRKPISSQRQTYVNKIWREYSQLTARPTKVFRPRKKKNLKIAQQFSQHHSNTFDVAFVPTADQTAKIKIEKGKMKVSGKYVTETTALFDFKKLMLDPDKEIARVLSEFPDAKKFIIKADEYEYNGPLTKKQARREIHNIMAKYSNPDENNYYQNWMFGVKVFTFHNQDDFINFVKSYNTERKDILSKRKNKTRSIVRKHGRKM